MIFNLQQFAETQPQPSEPESPEVTNPPAVEYVPPVPVTVQSYGFMTNQDKKKLDNIDDNTYASATELKTYVNTIETDTSGATLFSGNHDVLMTFPVMEDLAEELSVTITANPTSLTTRLSGPDDSPDYDPTVTSQITVHPSPADADVTVELVNSFHTVSFDTETNIFAFHPEVTGTWTWNIQATATKGSRSATAVVSVTTTCNDPNFAEPEPPDNPDPGTIEPTVDPDPE